MKLVNYYTLKDFLKHLSDDCLMNSRKNMLTDFKKDIKTHLASLAVKFTQNIKADLQKNGKNATVKSKVSENSVIIVVEPTQDKLRTNEISEKEVTRLFKNDIKIPIEMLNQEMSNQEFPVSIVDTAIQRTIDVSDKWVLDKIAKSY